ncbi:MAG: hypothetical protein LH614_10915 [Pyrinomonadaceae bacterium]|nr:hypothetical protein [Pyrinomonadaceae bacterium]
MLEIDLDQARANANLGDAPVLTGKNDEGLEYLDKAKIMFEQACQSDDENAS